MNQPCAYYGYNSHTDVETLTDNTGQTKATYGYTAYGKNDTTEFTGIDKPDTTDPTKEPYNAYRFNAKRWDQTSGTYDMGFRTYDPGLNTFTTRDMYNGALADMNLTTNPLTGNRYAFGGGNPTTNIELDGHRPEECGEAGFSCTQNSDGGVEITYTRNGPTKPPGKPWRDNTDRHNAARDAAASVIRLEALARTHDPLAAFQVDTECGIAQASKKIAGNNGRADICYREGNKMFVWEVKSIGVAQSGKGELADYMANMRNDPAYRGLDIVPGFDLPTPAVGYVPSTHQEVTAQSHPTDKGIILYETEDAKPPRTPKPVPFTDVVPESPGESNWSKFKDWWHENAKMPEHNPWELPKFGGGFPLIPAVPVFP